MATLADRILEALDQRPPGFDDDELAARLGVGRQAVNQACRKLAAQGRVNRALGANDKIVNTLSRGWQAPEPPIAALAPDGTLLSEDEVKEAVRRHLEGQGYEVRVAWGRERGIDIEATRADPDDRLVIEAKGEVKLQPQQVNYFLGALGELVQRMNDPDARYGLALPDNRQYRGLVSRLPRVAVERLRLVVFFVRRHGSNLRVELVTAPSDH